MSMDFRTAGDRVRALVAAKRPKDLARSALEPDAMRDRIIREAATHSDRFQAATNRRPEVRYTRKHDDGSETQETFQWSTFDELMRDVARAAFGYDEPKLAGVSDMRLEYQLNREVLERTLQKVRESRPYTIGNENEALWQAMALGNSLSEDAQDVLAEHIARSEQMNEQTEAAQSAQDLLDELRQQAREQHQANGEVDPTTVQAIKDAIAQRQQARAKLGGLVDEHLQSDHVQAIAQAAKKAADSANEAVEVMSMVQGLGAGHAHTLSADTQIELAQKLMANRTLMELFRDLGRKVLRFEHKRATRTRNVPIEPVGVTTGREIERMLPHEAARAFIPALKPLWMKDYAQRSILELDMQGEEARERGPIVEVHDGSGSMSGKKFQFATSLGLTCLSTCQREKRDFAGVEFGSTGEMRSWTFPANAPPDPRELLDFAGHFFAGGTDAATGMREALRIVKEAPAFSTADVILLTDGWDSFDDEDREIRDELRALGVRIHGISIQSPGNEYMQQMCDYVVDVADLAKDEQRVHDTLAENIT